jgi:hypothetical protein
MNLRQQLENALRALVRLPGAKIDHWHLAPPLTADECAAVEALGVAVPARLATLLAPMNGCALAWHIDGAAIAGSLNLPPLRSMLLGWSVPPGGAPCEGVLWTAEQSPEILSRLQRLRIVESIAGESRCIAFDPIEPDQLFLVDDEDIVPLTPPVDEALLALASLLGVEGAREALCDHDWQASLAALPFAVQMRR